MCDAGQHEIVRASCILAAVSDMADVRATGHTSSSLIVSQVMNSQFRLGGDGGAQGGCGGGGSGGVLGGEGGVLSSVLCRVPLPSNYGLNTIQCVKDSSEDNVASEGRIQR